MEVKPGYRRTEVGVIPEEWDCRRLSDLLDHSRPIRYGIVQPGGFESRGCLMLRSQDYSKGWVQPEQMHRVSSSLENQYRNARFHTGDLIMTIVGAGIGQVEIAPNWLDGAIASRSTARIAVDHSRADHRFVAACLQSPNATRQLLNCVKEAAQPVVSCRDVAGFFVPYPSLPEQHAIAAALRDVDELIGSLDRFIAKKRDLKQAAMQQLLTGRTRLPGFRGEWDERDLGSVIADLEAGVSVNSTDKDLSSADQEPAILKTSAVENGVFLAHEAKRIAPRDLQRARINPRAGSILISRMNTIDLVGECGFVDRDCPWLFVPDRLWMTRFRSETLVVGRWLSYVLSSPTYRQMLRSIATGTSGSMKNISKSSFLSLTIAFPSAEEQAAIAEVLSDMDAEIAALEDRRDKTRLLKQGMMQELLTGKTRLV